MAAILCDLMTSKLLDVKEMFGKIHPVKFAEALAPEMKPSMSRIISSVMRAEAPTFWEGLPIYVQQELVGEAMKGSTEFLANVIEDLQNHVYEVLDLKSMVVKLCEANKQDVVRMFQEVGESEFRIIEHSGAYFGFLFGVVQMCVFYVVDVLAPKYGGPLLPVFGFLVGWLTNYVALKLIFRPIHPTRVCGLFTIQGAFLRRQREVSEKFSTLNVELFCNAKNLWEEMMFGRLREEFGELVKRNTRRFTDHTIGASKPVATLIFGGEAYARMREHIAEQLVEELPKCVPCSYEYQDRALEVEKTVYVAMKNLPPDEFEGCFTPCLRRTRSSSSSWGGVSARSWGSHSTCCCFLVKERSEGEMLAIALAMLANENIARLLHVTTAPKLLSLLPGAVLPPIRPGRMQLGARSSVFWARGTESVDRRPPTARPGVAMASTVARRRATRAAAAFFASGAVSGIATPVVGGWRRAPPVLRRVLGPATPLHAARPVDGVALDHAGRCGSARVAASPPGGAGAPAGYGTHAPDDVLGTRPLRQPLRPRRCPTWKA